MSSSCSFKKAVNIDDVNRRIKTISKDVCYLLSNPGGSGTVSDVSVVSANGFAGSVATSTSTPAITLSTTITGILKGNGTAISAAVANTDYLSTTAPAATSFTVTGTGGAGYVALIPQSSTPATPGSGVVLFARSTGAFSWIGTNGFTRSLVGTGITADRSYTLPDADTTLVGTDNTQTLTNKTLTLPTIASINNGGTISIPSGADTIVTLTATQTITNKTLTSPTINGAAVSGTFTGGVTFSGNVVMSSSSTLFNTASNTIRTTNGGSSISANIISDLGSSTSTAGSLGMVFDNTVGGLGFTAANGTRRIVRASIILGNLTNTAGAETGDLLFTTQLAGAATTERWRISSAGYLSNTAAVGTGYLTLKAGTATASTAPIKLTDGTNLTTAEVGAIEFSSTVLYFTPSGSDRRPFRMGGRNAQSGTTYTIVSSDRGKMIGMTNTAARTITLIAASSFQPGDMLYIKDEAGTATTANVTINRAGSDTIDGATSVTISLNYGGTTLYTNGSNAWYVI